MAEVKVTKETLPEFLKSHVSPIVGEMVAESMKEAASKVKDEVLAGINKSQGSPINDLIDKSKQVDSDEIPLEEKGFAITRAARALAFANGDFEKAADVAEKHYKDDSSTKLAAEFLRSKVRKAAQAAGDFDLGGALTAETISSDFIELLRNRTAVRVLGANVVPMPGGTLTLMEQTGGATAEYVGENAGVNASNVTVGQVKLTAKKLRVTVPISNDLLLANTTSADTLVRNDMVAQARIKEDLVFLRNLGSTAFEPKGLLGFVTSGNSVAANGSVSLANTTTDLGKLVVALEDDNVSMERPGWIFAPRTWNYLMTVRDTNGNFAFRDEMLGGRLWGWPFVRTNQIPVNLGAGTESEIYLADFNDVLIGEQAGLDLDQTVIRLIARHDFQMRHRESVAILTAPTWGA
jgi:HK97 family phage major capsid protein